MNLTVAIVGRPNVGKSTLFNRLAGKRMAIVDNRPGVTRDRREARATVGVHEVLLIDTAGLEETREGLRAGMARQTEAALDDADLALFVIDARAGVTAIDAHFADWLRQRGKPVLLIANKCEGRAGEAGFFDAYALGFDDPLAVSAEHGDGLGELYRALGTAADAIDAGVRDSERDDGDGDAEAGADTDAPVGRIQLAIAGRPNVGKSTLANALIGEERLLTGPDAGVTRDAIAIDWVYRGQTLRLVDTAGLRRRAKVTDPLERMTAADALRAVRLAQMVLLVIDGTEPLHKQDLGIARMVENEGRALVVAVNKWDRVIDRQTVMRAINERLAVSLPQCRGIPVVAVSALHGDGLEPMMAAVLAAYEVWNRRVPTGRLNRWLEDVLAHHPPPLAQGRRVKLRYMTQAKARPPTFALFMNRPADLPDSYLRYLVNTMRADFDLPGVPLRLLTRKGKNPYA